MIDTGQCRNQTTVNPDSGLLQSNEHLPKKVSTKDNGAMKEGVMEGTQRKGFVQVALDKSKKDIPTFGHRMSISGISYLIERLSYEQYLAVNEIDFGGFWAIRTNVIPKSLGMWLLENYDYCGSFFNLSNHRILEFTKEDVHATLGLPMGPKKVMEGKTCDSCEQYNAILGSWRRRWGTLSGAPKIGKMRDGILDRGDHGDEFKRDFVIYEHVNWVIHKHGQLHLSKAINKLITIPVEGSSVSIPGMWLHTIMSLKVATEFKLIILHMQKGRLEVLFEYDVEEEDLKFWLNREEMMSMAGATEHLECILLDAWCVLMNKEKLKRNSDAPKRMFFSHNKAVDDETTLSAKFKAFIQVVNFEKQRCNWLKFKEMDLEQYLRLLRPIYCA
ncbi:hypothetical protein Cgig2_010774 [Carnegiea gigantea]|uniref:Uncharacterized protein n=1 Tax=Carnegiea gigantea TaxID=171969 RepID=A0A9Q1JPT9_9CARY|nr:hypothetical protein Cgig2_010774 [Carnegiea gigantea]